MSNESQMDTAFHKWITEIGNLCISMHVEVLNNDSNEEMAKDFMDGVTPEEYVKKNQTAKYDL